MSHLQAALNLAELGYAVFPCAPGGKKPITQNGLLDATTDGEQIEAWWTATPDANIGLATAGLLVIDVDVDGAGNANPWLADQPDKLLDLAAAPMSLTPRGGRHYWYRQPGYGGLRNTASKIAANVDTRADGGYVIVPPSVRTDGKTYRWAGESIEVGPDKLREPPFWLLKLVCEGGGTAAPKERTSGTQPANRIPDGQRNAALTSLAGTMRRVGMSAEEILAALRKANQDRCIPSLPDTEVETIARSVGRYQPDGIAVAVVEHHAEQDADDESQYFVEDPAAGVTDPGPLPEHLLSVPGFIGQVIEHNLAGAYKRQPALALAGALSLLATLTGRKVTDRYDTRTNLFLIGVCGTSSGKERSRVVNKEILHAAGLGAMIGPESIGSSAGLVSVIEQQPALLLQLDEFGRYLKTLADARQSHLFNIVTVLMRMFTSASSMYIGDAYADTKRIKTINQPHACLYGTTTPDTLLESLTSASITDGFLSRVLVIEGCEPEEQDCEKPDLPMPLIGAAAYWGNFKPGGNMSPVNPQPFIVEQTADAKALIAELKATAKSEEERLGEPLGLLWRRAVEKARKLALLYACSAKADAPVIDGPAVEWASAVVCHLTHRLIFLASRWLSENRQESHVKRVGRILEAAGENGVSKAGLTRATQWLTQRERTEVLGTLIESGLAKPNVIPTGKRPKTVYVHYTHCLKL